MMLIFRSIFIVLLFITIASCGLLPTKELPENAKIKFVYKNYENTELDMAVQIGDKWIYKINTGQWKDYSFKDNKYKVIFRTECLNIRKLSEDLYFCKLYKKISGNRMSGGSWKEHSKNDEWNLVACGLLANTVHNGNCKKLEKDYAVYLKQAANSIIDEKVKLIFDEKLRHDRWIASAPNFQNNLKIGTKTNNGIVIEIKRPLVLIQPYFQNTSSSVWVEITTVMPILAKIK